MPPTRRCCFAAKLTTRPTLQEPVCLVVVACPQVPMSGACNCMNLWSGCVFEENPVRVCHARRWSLIFLCQCLSDSLQLAPGHEQADAEQRFTIMLP